MIYAIEKGNLEIIKLLLNNPKIDINQKLIIIQIQNSQNNQRNDEKNALIHAIEKGNIDIKLEELVPLRDMREIKDTIEELLKKENYEGTNTDDYIRAIITNEIVTTTH